MIGKVFGLRYAKSAIIRELRKMDNHYLAEGSWVMFSLREHSVAIAEGRDRKIGRLTETVMRSGLRPLRCSRLSSLPAISLACHGRGINKRLQSVCKLSSAFDHHREMIAGHSLQLYRLSDFVRPAIVL